MVAAPSWPPRGRWPLPPPHQPTPHPHTAHPPTLQVVGLLREGAVAGRRKRLALRLHRLGGRAQAALAVLHAGQAGRCTHAAGRSGGGGTAHHTAQQRLVGLVIPTQFSWQVFGACAAPPTWNSVTWWPCPTLSRLAAVSYVASQYGRPRHLTRYLTVPSAQWRSPITRSACAGASQGQGRRRARVVRAASWLLARHVSSAAD